jgi:capsular exopolysaccharide synthesis family protein
MSRIADAVKRATEGVVDRAADGTGDAIPFFAHNQPAVRSPWKLNGEHSRQPRSSEEPFAVGRDDNAGVQRSGRVESVAGETVQSPVSEWAEKLLSASSFPFVAREQYNRLGTALHQAQLERSAKVVMLTSALSGEGKTLTAANLAMTLSESHRRRVLLVDADLRQPTLHELFDVARTPGLSDSLDTEGSLPVIQLSAGLSLLPAGKSGGDPIKTLTSDRMRAFIEDARRSFDWVLIDAAPVGLLTDARLLATMTDMVLLVALAGKTPYDAIQSAMEALGPERLAGVVLNRVVDAVLPHSRYRDYYEGRRT